MSRIESLQAAIPKKRTTEHAAFRIEQHVFWKEVTERADDHLESLAAQLHDLSAAGFVPNLLRREQTGSSRISQYWEKVPGVNLHEAPAEVRFSLELVIAVAELCIALQTYRLEHTDPGAHNCLWVGNHPHFQPVVAIDLADLEPTATPEVQVSNFAKTVFETWVGTNLMSLFEGLVFSGKIAEFLPYSYPLLLQKKEKGTLDTFEPDPQFTHELLSSIFETLELYQKVDNRVLEFVLQAYSATPPSFADLQRFYQQLLQHT